ncbi:MULTISPECIES: electron transport complex subunit RsxA [Tepidanaerobacter]|uniref:Ion-translocating oxidoreductase complex subunit A n=1 Tax=Tepidanaerobacter syntrophicus TaxID=224999 RepID=A0A0U9HGH3_9FIRM|nr:MULTISPECIES: electron transport complex subunit RsxA [Tepidanaerobacter]GAQ25870.1 electron transport complex protein RnfA [Tepidanaerobacter syntrophicus]GLI19397.1 electron transport complex subunit A [Tepidanaerobacter syntrophicus]GLI50505.1 electron transport complex subunit A [Tepidanaerobacter syntrophicus]HHV82779.1 electron transport complex subunit RsxA [Tepidanaerobacter syntrophicus]
MAKELFFIIVGSIFVNNFVFSRFLGNCPFLGVSNKTETAIGMGIATTFVLTMTGVAAYLIQNYVLVPFGLEDFLQIVAFILVIASLVQLVEMIVLKVSPTLYNAFGIFLPLITTNCIVMAVALLIPLNNYNLVESIALGFGAGVGFTLALALMSGIREELEFADVPDALKGPAIVFITAGLLSMIFLGFTGLVPLA